MLRTLQRTSGFVVEKLSRLRWPGPLSRWGVSGFAQFFKLNMSEAEKPLGSYSSVAELFTRRLRSDARPLGAGIVHVADAVLSQAGRFNTELSQSGEKSPKLLQVKGVEYALSELIQDQEIAAHYAGGTFAAYYLCPQDYHRVHQPWSGALRTYKQIPGYFWPVNNWGVSHIKGLFTQNERMVMEFDSPEGRFLVVMVAALNVGGIEPLFSTKVGVRVERGAELGVFHLGSSVVVVFDRELTVSQLQHWQVQSPLTVKVRTSFS